MVEKKKYESIGSNNINNQRHMQCELNQLMQ